MTSKKKLTTTLGGLTNCPDMVNSNSATPLTLIVALHVNCRGHDREHDVAKVGDSHQWKLVEVGGT